MRVAGDGEVEERRAPRARRPGRRSPAPPCRSPSRSATTTVAAAPAGNVIAAPTSAPNRPGAKARTAATVATDDGDRDRPPRIGRGGRGDRGADAEQQHRPDRRLELVADPEEAHAEARVGAEQRERGQRRAGDDVDGGRDDRDAPRRAANAPYGRDRRAEPAAQRERSQRPPSSGAPTPTISRSTSSLGSSAAASSRIAGTSAIAVASVASSGPASPRRQSDRAAGRPPTQISRLTASTSQRRLEISPRRASRDGDRGDVGRRAGRRDRLAVDAVGDRDPVARRGSSAAGRSRGRSRPSGSSRR